MWEYQYPDELYHWKYIKRERYTAKNGKKKWRYYYSWDELKKDMKDALGYDEKERLEDAKSKYEEAKRKDEQNIRVTKAYEDAAFKRASIDANTGWVRYTKEDSKNLSNLWNASNNSDTVLALQKREAARALREFNKTPLGKLEALKETIENGKKAIDKFVNKNKPSIIGETAGITGTLKEVTKTKSEKVEDIVKNDVKEPIKNGFTVKMEDLISDKNPNNSKTPYDHKTPFEHKKQITLPNGKTYMFGNNKDEYQDYAERLYYQKYEPEFMKKIPDISENTIYLKHEDMSKVNELYDPDIDSTSKNCANCSVAYELRRRGYDVEARLNDGTYNGKSDRFYDYFENAEVIGIRGDGSTLTCSEEFARKRQSGISVYEAKKLYKEEYNFRETSHNYTADSLSKGITANSPPGSRGMISVEWKSGGAHSITYEVTTNGTVIIRDSQTYDEYGLKELASRVETVRIVRTDHLELKEEILNAVVPNTDRKRKYMVDQRTIYPANYKPYVTYRE